MAVFKTSNPFPMTQALNFEWESLRIHHESKPALFDRILVPVDFSQGSNLALQYAVQLAAETGAGLLMFHSIGIQAPGPYLLINPMDMLYHNARRQVEKRLILAREAFVGHGLNPDRIQSEIRNGFAVENIVQLVDETAADLVILGSKGTNPGGARFWGTTATEVVRRAACPVMVIPASGGPSGLKEVVLGTDLAPPRASVLAPLFKLNRHFEARLDVVHVRKSDTQGSEEARTQWLGFVSAFKNLGSGLDLGFHDYKSDEKQPSEALKSYADFQEADLLVLVTHERGFLDRLFHRSAAKELALNVNLPILILHGEA